jgi:hypothetical protein
VKISLFIQHTILGGSGSLLDNKIWMGQVSKYQQPTLAL